MEATFVLSPNEFTPHFYERLREMVTAKGAPVTITVKTPEEQSGVDQRELFRQMEGLRLQMSMARIPPEVDINALIDEMNDTPV